MRITVRSTANYQVENPNGCTICCPVHPTLTGETAIHTKLGVSA